MLQVCKKNISLLGILDIQCNINPRISGNIKSDISDITNIDSRYSQHWYLKSLFDTDTDTDTEYSTQKLFNPNSQTST